jgi:vacuolar-type H+-ATPase subunit C/Vma6
MSEPLLEKMMKNVLELFTISPISKIFEIIFEKFYFKNISLPLLTILKANAIHKLVVREEFQN